MNILGGSPQSPMLQMVLRLVALYKLVILIQVITTWLPIDTTAPWYRLIHSLTEPFYAILRRYLPPVGMFDVCPVAAWLLLSIGEELLKLCAH